MKKILLKTLLFFLPFIIYAIAIAIVDPFGYFWDGLFVGKKENIVNVIDSNRRIRLVNFKKSPRPNIIIGASQAGHINPDSLLSRNWANICNGGANISDELYTFWKIVEKYPVDTVLFSIEPYNYLHSNGKDTRSVTTDAFKMLYNPLYYFTDTYVNKAFFKIVRGAFDKDLLKATEAPEVSQDVFWNNEIGRAKSDYKATIGLDKTSLDTELKKMIDYCEDNHITIIGIVPIGHSDLYEVYKDYMPTFQTKISGLFPVVYNFFFPNDFTINRNNFGDPFHAHNENWIYVGGINDIDTVHCKKYKN